uniref:Putative secreted protein n=1 Tax=Anopheles darlingi TaxID=43151 RepID=A0A2M4DNP3_ANODA
MHCAVLCCCLSMLMGLYQEFMTPGVNMGFPSSSSSSNNNNESVSLTNATSSKQQHQRQWRGEECVLLAANDGASI